MKYIQTTVELQWLEHLWDYEFVQDRGSLSQLGLIIVPGQEA